MQKTNRSPGMLVEVHPRPRFERLSIDVRHDSHFIKRVFVNGRQLAESTRTEDFRSAGEGGGWRSEFLAFVKCRRPVSHARGRDMTAVHTMPAKLTRATLARHFDDVLRRQQAG
jgi:hypothetical protein